MRAIHGLSCHCSEPKLRTEGVAGSEAISFEFEEIATSPAAPSNDSRKFWSENPRIMVKFEDRLRLYGDRFDGRALSLQFELPNAGRFILALPWR